MACLPSVYGTPGIVKVFAEVGVQLGIDGNQASHLGNFTGTWVNKGAEFYVAGQQLFGFVFVIQRKDKTFLYHVVECAKVFISCGVSNSTYIYSVKDGVVAVDFEVSKCRSVGMEGWGD